MMPASLSENDMRSVHEARAQSRAEAARLEQLKQQIRAAYLSQPDATEPDLN
jgi:hypothetical protein